MKRWRVAASESDLRYWEYEGILPRAVRQWHEGAVRAIYPVWYLRLVRYLRQMQHEGLSLAEIGTRLRTLARVMLIYEANDPRSAELRKVAPPHASIPEHLHVPPALLHELERFADLYADFREVPVKEIVVRVVGIDGRGTDYPIPIAPLAAIEEAQAQASDSN